MFFSELAELPKYTQKLKIYHAKQSENPLVVGLVLFGVGTWREIMDMDIENAIKTFSIHYIAKYNEWADYENNKPKK